MTTDGLTIVLPMLNEVENAEGVLEELFASFKDSTIELAVVAVDDGSTDSTGQVLEELSQRFPGLTTDRHQQRRGYGAAIRTGLGHATTRFVGWMDGDGQYEPADLHHLLNALQGGSVAALGVRVTRSDPVHRCILGKVGTVLASMISGLWLRDVDAGLKVFDAQKVDLSTMVSTGGYISTEVIRNAKQVGEISQVDISHRQRMAGKSTGGSGRVIAGLALDFLRCSASSAGQ